MAGKSKKATKRFEAKARTIIGDKEVTPGKGRRAKKHAIDKLEAGAAEARKTMKRLKDGDAAAAPTVPEPMGDGVYTCIYCKAEIDANKCPACTPAIDADFEWDAIAEYHGSDCEWVKTRAHRIRMIDSPAPTIEGNMQAAQDASDAAEAALRGSARKPRAAKAPKAEAGPKKLSALDAAYQVLAATKTPMGTSELIEEMTKRGLWTSPGGATPAATLYSAMLREITTKGDKSRFTRPEKGKFALAAATA